MDEKSRIMILRFQGDEITEHYVYKRLSGMVRNKYNSGVMKRISEQTPGSCSIAKERVDSAKKQGINCLDWFMCFKPLKLK